MGTLMRICVCLLLCAAAYGALPSQSRFQSSQRLRQGRSAVPSKVGASSQPEQNVSPLLAPTGKGNNQQQDLPKTPNVAAPPKMQSPMLPSGPISDHNCEQAGGM